MVVSEEGRSATEGEGGRLPLIGSPAVHVSALDGGVRG